MPEWQLKITLNWSEFGWDPRQSRRVIARSIATPSSVRLDCSHEWERQDVECVVCLRVIVRPQVCERRQNDRSSAVADRRQRAFSCHGGDSASPMHKYLFSCWRKVAQTGDVVTSDTESRGRIPAPQVPVTRAARRHVRGGRESPRHGSPWCLMSSMAGVAAD